MITEAELRERETLRYEGNKGLPAKEWRQPLETTKGKEMDYPLEPPEVTQPCQHF